MNRFVLHSDPRVEERFMNYPDGVRKRMQELRELLIETAKETGFIEVLEETLKWGEPAYLTKGGSTVRMDWKAKQPEEYALYFKCTSRLVETFREIFGPQLNYQGNRAIILRVDEALPKEILKLCMLAALRYHRVKNLLDLGIPIRQS